MNDYSTFLARKAVRASRSGIAQVPALAAHLYPFQRDAVAFGLRAGSWACFFDTGLGKTAVELEWCRHAAVASNGRALILTPLAVARQIEAEGKRWGYPIRVIREQDEAGEGINVCNYDRLGKLQPDAFGAIALDESSILKNMTGITSRSLIRALSGHRFRMAATATPAPNDHMELGQHAEALGVMAAADMLVRWFIHDSGDTKVWRLKGHAQRDFWDWVASWARMASHPRDLGDDQLGFDLPPLDVVRHQVDAPVSAPVGALFAGLAVNATDMHRVKRQTASARASAAARLIGAESDERWVVWCDTDHEADALLSSLAPFGEAVCEVRGSHPVERKEETLAAFDTGARRVLISKPSICGWGLNWQHTARVLFVGRSFSYEAWYQAVRRCWRFGQKRPVQVHVLVAEGEARIGAVLDRKTQDHAAMRVAMRAAMTRERAPVETRASRITNEGRLPAWIPPKTASGWSAKSKMKPRARSSATGTSPPAMRPWAC